MGDHKRPKSRTSISYFNSILIYCHLSPALYNRSRRRSSDTDGSVCPICVCGHPPVLPHVCLPHLCVCTSTCPPSRFPTRSCAHFYPHACYMSHPSHPPRFHHLNNVRWGVQMRFWLQIQRSRVRSPALPDFLSSSGSGTGSTQPREPREVNWGATWMKKVTAPGLENRD